MILLIPALVLIAIIIIKDLYRRKEIKRDFKMIEKIQKDYSND